MFLAFRTQTDVSSPVTDNAELYRKQTDIIQECLVELKSKREEAKELKQTDCPWTSFGDVMVMP